MERVIPQINSDPRIQMKTLEQVIKSVVEDLAKVRIKDYDDSNNEVYMEIEGEFIEPTLLQVVSRRVWKEMIADGTEENKGIAFLDSSNKVEVALEGYYEVLISETIKRTRVSEKDIRKWIEEKLITFNGGKNIVLRGKTFSEGILNQVTEELAACGLISEETRSGNIFYGLTYDRLIDPIIKSNFRWKHNKFSLLKFIFK